MPLLLDDDYRFLKNAGLDYEEDEAQRFLVLKRYPLSAGLYVAGGKPVDCVDVLNVIPPNYNTQGPDMFWLYPQLARADGRAIPNINGPGPSQDSRTYKDIEYCRWSRHFHNKPWKPKVDNIEKVLSRIEWALRNPDAHRS